MVLPLSLQRGEINTYTSLLIVFGKFLFAFESLAGDGDRLAPYIGLADAFVMEEGILELKLLQFA